METRSANGIQISFSFLTALTMLVSSFASLAQAENVTAVQTSGDVSQLYPFWDGDRIDFQPVLFHTYCFTNLSVGDLVAAVTKIKLSGSHGLMTNSSSGAEEYRPGDDGYRKINNYNPGADVDARAHAGVSQLVGLAPLTEVQEVTECDLASPVARATIDVSFENDGQLPRLFEGHFTWRFYQADNSACWAEAINYDFDEAKPMAAPTLRLLRPLAKPIFVEGGHVALLASASQTLMRVFNGAPLAELELENYDSKPSPQALSDEAKWKVLRTPPARCRKAN